MVRSCCAYNCTERASKDSLVSFHTFPKDAELRKKWIVALKRKKFTPKYSEICSQHFVKEDFLIYVGKRKLKTNAVPTVFDFPKHLRKQIIPRRSRKSTVSSHESESQPGSSEKQLLQTRCISPIADTIKEEALKSPSLKKNTKRFYFGDFKEEDLSNLKSVKLMWQIAKKTIDIKNKKIKYLKVKTNRQQTRIRTLQNLINHLKE